MSYREVFVEANGPGPWPCDECGGMIERLGRHVGDGNVHHRDHDHSNDDPSNLMVLHHECHARLHTVGVPKARKHVEKVNAANRGQKRTPEACEKMRQAQLKRATCSNCGYTSSKTWITRHSCER